MNFIVENFSYCNSDGECVLQKDFLPIWCKKNTGIFFLSFYCWNVGEEKKTFSSKERSLNLLPDASGFICFESKRNTDNCTLLDAYGKERLRLTVPYALTGKDIPENAEMWFRNIDGPYVNPQTGETGEFGVGAWIEYAGDYYFELDYQTGQFLWGKPIRF